MRNNLEFFSELDIDLEACLVCARVKQGSVRDVFGLDHAVWEQGWVGVDPGCLSSRRI